MICYNFVKIYIGEWRLYHSPCLDTAYWNIYKYSTIQMWDTKFQGGIPALSASIPLGY